MSASDIDVEQHSIGSPIDEYMTDIVRQPGFFEAGENCGDLKPVGFCERGHVQIAGAEPCNTRKCPHHWGTWRKNSAESIVARAAAYRAAQGGPSSRRRRMVHVVEAPPQDQRWTVSRFWNHRSKSHDVAEDAGARGGVTIPHPYDTNDEADELYAEAVDAGVVGEDYGKWRFVRERADTWDDMKEAIEVRPHFHDLAPAEDVDADDRPEGWVVHNIRSLKRFYVDVDEVPGSELVDGSGRIVRDRREVVREGYEDMARLTMYLLSHAGAQQKTGDLPQRSSMSYWGELSPNSFDPEEELDADTWETIQKHAAKAVGKAWDEDDESGEPTEGECSCEDCEATVRPLSDLEEYLSNVGEYAGWFGSLEKEQQWEIWGLWTSLGDRPPPGRAVGDLPNTMDGEIGDREDGQHDLPPSQFDRNPSIPDEVAGSETAVIEWLRDLGRQRLDRSIVHGAIAA